jgi:hypothetical protein
VPPGLAGGQSNVARKICNSQWPLQPQIAQILRMPVEYFFEGLPHERGPRRTADDAASVQYVADHLATADGLQLAQAFMQIPNAKLRRSIVNLVEQLANSEDH